MGRLLAAIYDGPMRATEAACPAGWRAELLGGVPLGAPERAWRCDEGVTTVR